MVYVNSVIVSKVSPGSLPSEMIFTRRLHPASSLGVRLPPQAHSVWIGSLITAFQAKIPQNAPKRQRVMD